jgi:hypothetical protein
LNKQTLKALKGSIKKWEAIVAGTGVDLGCDNCPLCERFLLGMGSCVGCPVSEKTGRVACIRTPYGDFASAQPLDSQHPYVANTPDSRKHARRMLAFLKRLLP